MSITTLPARVFIIFIPGTAADLYNFYKSSLSSWTPYEEDVSDLNGSKLRTLEVTNDMYYVQLFIDDDGKVAYVKLDVTIN